MWVCEYVMCSYVRIADLEGCVCVCCVCYVFLCKYVRVCIVCVRMYESLIWRGVCV